MRGYEDNTWEHVDCERYYETMAFHSSGDKYDDADVSRQVFFDSQWRLDKLDDVEANKMHERVVDEITAKLQKEAKCTKR